MHLQQTKRTSIKSGGAQYYFHGLSDQISLYLRVQKCVPVALVTPYGATPSSFLAVAGDAKRAQDGEVVPGKVGHDRVQKAGGPESIGEAIRHWYKLKSGAFERIDLKVEVLDDKFYLTPVGYKYAGGSKTYEIPRPEFPLSFNDEKQSQLWRRQLDRVREAQPEMLRWSLEDICRVAQAHADESGFRHVREEDLLRAAGALKVLGVELGPYVGKGYDCEGEFRFLDYEPYKVPIEIKKSSKGFKYQQSKYSPEKLSRAVILCMRHDLRTVPRNVDVVQLSTLCSALAR
jgi:hypothetical protein